MGRRTAATILAAAALVGSCGLGDRAALEATITQAPARLESPAVSGSLTLEQRILATPDVSSFLGGAGAAGARFEIPDGGVTVDTASATLVIDHVDERAAITLDGETTPGVLVRESVFYGRRAGIPADDARPWVRFDLGDLRDDAGELDAFAPAAERALVALHPPLLIDLVGGTLTGSIETLVDDADGTQHFAVNVSLSKALDESRQRYPDEQREHMERLLELIGIDGDVHPGEVWLDDAGDLVRFRIRLQQRPIRGAEFELVVTLDIGEAAALNAPFPTPDQVLSVDSVVRFASTVARSEAGADDEIPASIAGTLGSGESDDADSAEPEAAP